MLTHCLPESNFANPFSCFCLLYTSSENINTWKNGGERALKKYSQDGTEAKGKKCPNCAIMIFNFDEAKSRAEGEPMKCKFTLQQIVDPQQSN